MGPVYHERSRVRVSSALPFLFNKIRISKATWSPPAYISSLFRGDYESGRARFPACAGWFECHSGRVRNSAWVVRHRPASLFRARPTNEYTHTQRRRTKKKKKHYQLLVMDQPGHASELDVQGVIAHYISQYASLPIICGKTQVSKATGPKRRAQDCPPYQCGCVWFCLVGRVTQLARGGECAPSFRSRFTTRPPPPWLGATSAKRQRQRFGFLQPFQFGAA